MSDEHRDLTVEDMVTERTCNDSRYKASTEHCLL